jgi:hypothetical protein
MILAFQNAAASAATIFDISSDSNRVPVET